MRNFIHHGARFADLFDNDSRVKLASQGFF